MRTEPVIERLRSVAPGRADAGAAGEAALGELGAFVAGRSVVRGDATEMRSPYDGSLVAVVHRAGPTEIEAAIAGAVRAFEDDAEAALLAARRGARAHRRRSASARDELRAHDRARGRQADQDRPHRGRARRLHVPSRRRGDEADLRRDRAAGLAPGHRGPRRLTSGASRSGRSPGSRLSTSRSTSSCTRSRRRSPPGTRSSCGPRAQTPISALKLGEIVARGRLARGAESPSCRRPTADAAPLVEDDADQAAHVHRQPRRRLGAEEPRRDASASRSSSAATPRVIVHADADAAYAAERIVWGGTINAGQTCISVQRV